MEQIGFDLFDRFAAKEGHPLFSLVRKHVEDVRVARERTPKSVQFAQILFEVFRRLDFEACSQSGFNDLRNKTAHDHSKGPGELCARSITVTCYYFPDFFF